MFTGIIKEIGTVKEVKPKRASHRVSIEAKALSKEAVVGDSVSVDGACLTVADKAQDHLCFDIITEALKATTLGRIKKKDKVNLEPSLKLKDGLSGHIVTGHIDEIAKIKKITKYSEGIAQLIIGLREKNIPLLTQKGSVAVNGISLTVKRVGRDFFIADIIPHTFKATTMQLKKVGDELNIEFDLIAKYSLKSLSKYKTETIDKDFLKRMGFL